MTPFTALGVAPAGFSCQTRRVPNMGDVPVPACRGSAVLLPSIFAGTLDIRNENDDKPEPEGRGHGHWQSLAMTLKPSN